MKEGMEQFQFPEVRVVEASAGSGKTFCLAKRYVQLLLNPELHFDQVPVRNILAITFTNKATIEMKGRILEFLKRIALNDLNEEEEGIILKPIGITRSQAQQKAFAVMEALICHYNFFQVQTIDSLINALLSGCAFKVGLSANFRIKTNAEDYLQYSLDQLIESTSRDKQAREVFERFLHQYLFLENKGGWFPKKDMLNLMSALYAQRNTFAQDFMMPDVSGQDLVVHKGKILEQMRKLKEELPEGMHKGFTKSFEAFMDANHKSFDYDNVSDYFARHEIPALKSTKVPGAVDKRWTKIRRLLEDLAVAEAFSLFNPYIEAYRLADEFFRSRAAKDDVLFLGDLNRKARDLFDEGEVSVEELYYRLATRFYHYLVDEFQDTSILQWKNLELMVEEALSKGGSLFYVGDKKQAIFGFRGGEVGLFDHLQERLKSFNVNKETLQINYRSREAIVEFNNHVFSIENLKTFIHSFEKDNSDGFTLTPQEHGELEQIFGASHQQVREGKAGGSVRVEYIDGKNKEERSLVVKEKVVELVNDLSKRFCLHDIAVLTRNNKDIEEVTSWLLEEGIAVESERTLNIKENALIKELLAFLTFLDSPIDNLSFVSFACGDVLPAVSGITKNELRDFFFSLRQKVKEEKDVYLYKEFQRQYPKIWKELLGEFFRNVGLYPLYEFMVSVVNRLKIPENFPDQQGFVMRFLEVIKAQEEENSDTGSFLEAFELMEGKDLYVRVSDPQAVRVMTFHKAKGLEFPAVIIPQMEMKVRPGSGGSMGQQSYVTRFGEGTMQLMRIKKKYIKFSEELFEIQRQEYVRALLSELNTVYVALTRASEEMHVFVPTKAGSSRNLAVPLIPEEVLSMGNPEQGQREIVLEKRPQPLPVSRYRDWLGFLRDEFKDQGSLARRDKILKGEVMHYALSFVKNLQGQDLSKVIDQALEQAAYQYPRLEQGVFDREEFEGLLRSEQLNEFFYLDKGEVFTEKEFVSASGQSRRIDRLIVKDDEAWVIDYKSSRDDETSHHQQVYEYMDIVSQVYPGRKVKGFLIYLDGRKTEIERIRE